MHPYTAMKAANERVGGAGAAPAAIRGGLAPKTGARAFKKSICVVANVYQGGALVGMIKFFLTEERKWGDVLAYEHVKKIIEDRVRLWEGKLNNWDDIFDVLEDIRDALGLECKVTGFLPVKAEVSE